MVSVWYHFSKSKQKRLDNRIIAVVTDEKRRGAG